jgi:hypothetical protein
MAVISWGLSVFFPVAGRQAPTARLLASWIDRLPLGADTRLVLANYTSGHSPLAHPDVRLIAYLIPLAVITAVAITLVVLLAREDRIDSSVTRSLTRIALVCGVLHAISLPIFTRDLWLSVGWGRMALEGVNPYEVPMSPHAREGLPFPDRIVDGVPARTGGRMTYGPLWAVIGIGVAKLGGSSAFVSLVVSKVVLFAAWLVVLLITRRIAARTSERDAAIVTVLMGVMPLLSVQALAEGHNDIAMVACLTLWFQYATRNDYLGSLSPAPLVAAVLLKYVAAPLGLLDLIAAIRRRPNQLVLNVAVAAVSITFMALVFAPFYSGPRMLEAMATMRNWNFFSPADALVVALRFLTGASIPARLVAWAVMALGLLIAARAAWRFYKSPTPSELCLASLVFLWVVAFTVVGHVWPWFLIWPLPFAALLWEKAAGKMYLLCVALSPLMNLAWFLADGDALWTSGAGLVYFTSCAVGAAVIGLRHSGAIRRQALPVT